jgi:hypothetical protein
MLLLFVHRFDQVAGVELGRRAKYNAEVLRGTTRNAGKGS